MGAPFQNPNLKLWVLVREMSWLGLPGLETNLPHLETPISVPPSRLACLHNTGWSGDFLGH